MVPVLPPATDDPDDNDSEPAKSEAFDDFFFLESGMPINRDLPDGNSSELLPLPADEGALGLGLNDLSLIPCGTLEGCARDRATGKMIGGDAFAAGVLGVLGPDPDPALL